MGLFLNDIKSHFKLDLFDKIIIATIFLLGAIFSPVFASENLIEDVGFMTESNIAINPNSSSLVSYNGSTLYYVELEPGYRYYIINTSQVSRIIGMFNSLEVGENTFIYSIPSSETLTINGSSNFLYVGNSATSTNYIKVQREKLEGMQDFIDNLTYYNGFDNLWNTFISVIPYTTVVVLVCIGLLIIRRLLSSLSKGKSRI